MAGMTLANLITDDLSSSLGGPASGNLLLVGQSAANAYTNLTGGHDIAFGPPNTVATGNGVKPAMRSLAWLLERAWKWQQTAGSGLVSSIGVDFITKNLKPVRLGTSVYSTSGRNQGDILVHYGVDFWCQMDDLNDTFITSVNDLT